MGKEIYLNLNGLHVYHLAGLSPAVKLKGIKLGVNLEESWYSDYENTHSKVFITAWPWFAYLPGMNVEGDDIRNIYGCITIDIFGVDKKGTEQMLEAKIQKYDLKIPEDMPDVEDMQEVHKDIICLLDEYVNIDKNDINVLLN
jgi:hypothetical protein